MYFTQEDYKKIENWLHRNSVKDTEFQEALPFTGKEIVTVVQDGHNRKVNIQEFINQLYKHGVEDFLNVTNTYRANNITLKEAISLIPAEARKEGQVITFLNTKGNWEIYQFTGKLNQWNNTTLWNNPFDWEKFVVDSILPDEEDLTKSEPDAKGNSYLSLKDRKYEPDKYSGLGRKILRKRVVEIEDPIYGTQEKNLLLQADFAEDNTIYEIRYDFDLNGEEITIPENCVLDFQGGSLSNGSVVGDGTYINANIYKIFNLNLSLKGNFSVPYIYSEWYGAIGDGANDDSFAINKALSTPIITLRLLDKVYNVLNTTDVAYNVDSSTKKANIIVPNNKIIIGTSTSDYTNNSTISVSENADSDFGLFISGRQVKLEGIRVISNKNSNDIYSCNSLIVTQRGVSHLTFNQVHARFCNNNAMDIDCYGLIFNLCSAGDCGGVAYYLHGTSGNNTSATLISCAAGCAKSHGYLFHKMTYCTLISCSADTCGFDSKSLDTNNIQHAYHIMECRFISMIGCGCEGCYKSIKTSRDTRGLNVTACDFLLFEESKYPEGFDYSDTISLDFTEASRFVNTNIGRRFSTNNLITATYSAKVVFEDCFLQKANDSGRGGLLNQSNIKYIDGDRYKNITIINNIKFANIEGYSENISSYNNTTIYDSVTVKIGNNEISDKQYENINGKIILTSRTDNSRCPVNSNNAIKNCTNFTLRNITLNFNNFSGDTGFVIDNSVVIFDNVSFVSYHNFTTKKLLSVTNSRIIFKNCKTTPGYASSKFIKDVINVDDASIIEFVDKDCGTTEERNSFTPLYKGFEWFDTDLSKPVYYNSSKWVDATGADV